MQTTPPVLVLPARLRAVAALSMLLEKLERQPRQASAEQYRRLAVELQGLLAEVPRDAALERLLQAFPAAAELYENLRYEHAGLCLSELDNAISAEQLARSTLQRLRRPH